MANKQIEKLKQLVGMGGDRDAAPPRYRAIAPGLIVTDEAAWAWFEMGNTNSDLLGEAGRDAEQDKAEDALKPLMGRECHLKIVWGQISGDEYIADMDIDSDDVPEAVKEWAAIRADRLDDLAIPTKRTFLGVKIEDRRVSGAAKADRSAFGDTNRITDTELARYENLVAQIGRPLSATLWRVRLASPELLGWMISREMHRSAPVPASRVIEGSPLHRLVQGRVTPFPDHLAFSDPDGETVAYSAVLTLADMPEELVTPGQEWLAILNGIETTPLEDEVESMPALAEASVRFTLPRHRQARKTVEDARKMATEQRKSAAKGSAEEPDDSILEAEGETRAMSLELARRRTMLVHVHPRVMVTAPTRAELDAKISAVQSAYDSLGIMAVLGADEQRELWVETLPNDHVRVGDLDHYLDATAFTASWFWGGSRVGSQNARIPAIGYTTGSTQNLVRWLATDAVENSDAPVTIFTGRTRRGKTTAMQIAMIDVQLAPTNVGRAPWGVMIDYKGDAGGLADIGPRFGFRSELRQVTEKQAGLLDPFLTSDPNHAIENTVSQLSLLVPRAVSDFGEADIQIATSHVAQNDAAPRAWKVVERLKAMSEDDPENRQLGKVAETLTAATTAGWGRLVAGVPNENTQRMPMEAGITVLQLPGLTLPSAETSVEKWTNPQRASIAALRGVLGWCSTVAGARELRDRPKVVAVPEVHLLTATEDGRAFLSNTARMGAALGMSLLLDTQDAGGMKNMIALNEGTSAIFGFAQVSVAEQDNLAEMVGLPVGDPEARATISSLDQKVDDWESNGKDGDDDIVRRGHCIYRDRRRDVATVQWDVPSDEIIALLDTSAAAESERYRKQQQMEAAAAEAAEADDEAEQVEAMEGVR